MNVLKYLALVLICLIASTGCARLRTNISGTVTRGGEPLVWHSEGGFLLVIFVPEDRTRDGSVYRATTDRDTGAFRIPEIRAGKYLVAIQQFDERHQDALATKYDLFRSTLRYEVTEDNQVIDIDLPSDLP